MSLSVPGILLNLSPSVSPGSPVTQSRGIVKPPSILSFHFSTLHLHEKYYNFFLIVVFLCVRGNARLRMKEAVKQPTGNPENGRIMKRLRWSPFGSVVLRSQNIRRISRRSVVCPSPAGDDPMAV
jgi:hypothetical protein